MRQIITLLSLIFCMSFGFAQTNPIDFEVGGNGAGWTWTVFENGTNPAIEIIANPVSGAGNTSATVAKFTALQIGQIWAGCETTDIGTFTFDSDNSLVKMWVYKDVISEVKLKFEGTSAAVESTGIQNTLTGQWEELTFDFSFAIGNTYNKFVLFPDFVARSQDNIIYYDNITFNAGTALPAPTTGAPAPTHDETTNSVFSIYSDSYTNLAGTNFNPNWGQSTSVTVDESIGGNNTLLYTALNYQGTNLGSNDGTPQDVSGQNYIHIDFWTPNATVLNFFLISQSSGERSYALPITTEQWVSVDIPLSHYSGLGLNLSDIFQFKVDGGDGTVVVYFDNWYFWTATGANDATLSDLQLDGTTIDGFSPNILSYDEYLPNGTTIVPTVTATPNDPNAQYVVNATSALPGTTSVVVTAQDGVTMQTYNVNFLLEDPVPAVGAPVPVHDETMNNVFSIYSDSYTNLANTNFNPFWGQSTQVAVDELIGGNNTLVYTNLNYQGTNLGDAGGAPQNVSIYDTLHIDFWTPDATALNFFLISQTSGERFYALPITTEQWVSVDIPLSHFSDQGLNLTDIWQFKVDGGDGSVTVYFDNWYFYSGEPGADATLSDLQVDGETVDGFSSFVMDYTELLPYGTTVVPTVTATTTDPEATYVVNDATSLPGATSVVVTADDGITTLTYNVSFVVEDSVPNLSAPVPVHDPILNEVFCIYSDNYVNLQNTNFNPSWGQNTQVTVGFPIGGNGTLLYDNLNYQGTNLGSDEGSPQDVSGHDYFHMDFWTPNATVLNFYLISQSSGEIAYALPVSDEEWVSVNIPLSYFSGQGLDLTDIFQFKVDGGTGTETVYFDNWYFWKATEGSDATLSDLQVDGETINGFSQDILEYDEFLPQGTTVVPTVTATPSAPNATHVVNAASSLPGTTSVVVTAEDGLTIMTYYVNFKLMGSIPTEGAPIPVHTANNVFSIYSDSYTNLENTNFNPSWGQTTSVSLDEPIGGNNTLLYTNFNYQGTNLGSLEGLPQDVSGYDFFHLDFWTPDATTLNFFLISQSGAEVPYALTIANEEWVSIDIPMSYFLDQGLNLTDIWQFKVDGGDGTVTVYFDNWYFWNNASGADATLSDLSVDGESIEGFSPSVLNYEMLLPIGTTVVPVVTATTTDPAATYVVNDATELPGTTSVVVTAIDDVTILTYNISFTLEDPIPVEGAPIPLHNETLNNIFSIYSDSYTNLENTNFNPSWGQSTQVVVDEQIGGNNTLVYSNLNYQGTNLGSDEGTPQDVSGHEYFHIDFWTPNATTLNFFLISQSSGEVSYSLPVSTSEWVSVNIPLSHFSGQGLDLTDIFQFKLDGGDGSTTVYLDNWYFWNVAEGGDATLSSLLVDGETIEGFSSDVFSYDVELPEGTTDVPVVTVTTTDENATYDIVDAIEIPGTTEIVVTAQDGFTVMTYYVNFILPTDVPAEAAPTPSQSEENVISMFSNVYTNVDVDTWLTDWSVAVLEDIEIQGDATKKYSSLDYAGVETVSSPIDLEAAGMAFLHIDFWTPNSTAFRIKLVDFGGDGYGNDNDTEAELEFIPLQSEWNSLNIPLEDFVGMNMSDINQFIISANPSGQSIVYIDNVFYYKDPVGLSHTQSNEMNIYPNPTLNSWYVNSEEVVHEIQILDISGRVVLSVRPEQRGNIKVDASGLSRGFYLIKINGIVSQEFKLIKE